LSRGAQKALAVRKNGDSLGPSLNSSPGRVRGSFLASGCGKAHEAQIILADDRADCKVAHDATMLAQYGVRGLVGRQRGCSAMSGPFSLRPESAMTAFR
jgi:hypothetical protein